MSDSSLKQLLARLKKLNELSKEAINELSQFFEKNDSDVADENSIIGNLTASIISLSEEADEVKKFHQKLITDKPECSEGLAVIEGTQVIPQIVGDSSGQSTENCISQSTEELVEEVVSNNTNERVEELAKVSNSNEEQSKCKDDPHSIEDSSSKREDKPLLKIVDFNKLVDPRNLELMDKNEKRKEKSENMSIIILSSSDDESIAKIISQKTTNKKKKDLKEKEVLSSSVEASRPIKSKKISKGNVYVPIPEVVSTPNLNNLNITNPEKTQEPITIGDIIINPSHTDYMTIKNDKKFSCKLYVKLLRVPCEEMNSYYSKKNECRKSSEEMTLNNSAGGSDSVHPKVKDKISQCSNESDCDQNEQKLNKKSKFTKNKKKKKNESSDEGMKSGAVKRRMKGKVKTSVQETSDSSEGEHETTLKSNGKEGRHEKSRNLKKNKKDINCKSKEKTKGSKYLFSDDDGENDSGNTDISGKEEELEKSNESARRRSSDDDAVSEGCEKDDDLEETEKNSSKIKNKKSTESTIEVGSSSDDAENDITEKKSESSDSDQSFQKKNKGSNKKIVINSDDSENSDFDTFFKKNNLSRNVKKIKALNSDSEDDASQVVGTERNESEKESPHSDNPSDKEEEDEQKKRKRKRIKEMKDDSSDSDEAVTRKKIKKLISKDSLSVQTKKAAAEERERKHRILEKQKKYNQIYESSDLASSTVEKLVLDVDEETEQPLLEVDRGLVSKLKPHQASGIQFMWDACFESLKRIGKSQGSGCILAHCMGLGKTLQVIALTNTLLEEERTKVKKVLIVTPLSTVLNWKAEFKNWLSDEEDYEIFELVSVRSQNAERACYIREWHENGGVMIMSYAMFRNLSNEKNRKISKKIRTTFVEGLVDPGPDLVICDEGHLLKNEKTSLSIAMNKIKTRRRIVLTGTPLQNNLKEYYCMVQFVKPNLLGTYREYLNRFVNPITNGQYTDSTQYDINLMRRRSHVLHKLLDGIVQRRDYSVLSPYLPPKFEYVLFLTLSQTQKKLYKHYMDHFARKSDDEGSTKTSFLFKDFQALSRICIHPRVLLDKSNDDQLKYQSDEESVGSLKDFIDDGDETSSTPESSDSESNSDSKKKKKKRVTKRVTRAQKNDPTVESDSEEENDDETKKKEWWQEYCDGEELDNIAHSTKILLLFEILKECEQIGDKVLLFSQSLYALNLIEYFLEKVDEATQNGNADKKTCGYTGSWTPGLDYFRLDGSTNCGLRSEWCDTFNKESNSRARLFLLSTRAGGLGINLVAANRVILFDVSWNPSSDVQSIYRVYRFGQLKPSYIYRFVVYGTMEMKIYERQVTKQAISKRVIDEQQIDRHYNQNDLAELYKFEEPNPEDRPTPMVPKDVLLGEMLIKHEDLIYKYHEHQSLLENKTDEILNEEERKAAWDEFENEKVERTKQPLIGKFSVNTVQLALRSIIQRDNPTWNNSQILSIIPQLIQQLNLQLSMGDQTMYNRIAAEIKVMQEEYARKMQLQYYNYRMQVAQNQMQNMFQPPFPMMQHLLNNRMPHPSMAGNFNASGSGFNPNEVVDLN